MDQALSLTASQGYLLLAVYGVIMVAITYLFARWKSYKTIQGFLVAERNVSWWLGATSIAASWLWALALFISVQQSYQQGLPGIFWFTFPNMVALLIYIWLAPKIRERLPFGYTLPQYIAHRLNSEKVHKMYLSTYFFYQLMAVVVQLFAGGGLVSFLTGIPFINAIIIMAVIVLAYGAFSGIVASFVTDFIQFLLIIVGVMFVVPWTISMAGGWSVIGPGLGGVSGQFTNIFDPGVAFSFGIVTAIGLISGAISDQQQWQRAFAIKKKNLVRSFAFGALLFGIVPITLSLLGFLAANESLGITLPAGLDPSMIGVVAVGSLLPSWAIALFVVMLLSALFSTLDSALSATSSLYATDVMKRTDAENALLAKVDNGESLSANEQNVLEALDKRTIRGARMAMYGITLLGLLVALAAKYISGFGLHQLFWISNTIAACIAVPTVLSLYWSRLDARGVFWGVLVSFVVGIPFFIYSNIVNNSTLIVAASLFIVVISTGFCLAMPKKRT